MKPAYPAHLSFPFKIANDGRSAHVGNLEDHIRDELYQLMITNPGDRPFQPNFGGGARQLIFESVDDARMPLIKAHMTDAINTALGHRIKLENLEVSKDQSTLEVAVTYSIHGSKDQRVLKFQKAFI